jgi:hypothetical protein
MNPALAKWVDAIGIQLVVYILTDLHGSSAASVRLGDTEITRQSNIKKPLSGLSFCLVVCYFLVNDNNAFAWMMADSLSK